MKHLIEDHAAKHLSHHGKIRVRMGRMDANGVYSATVVLTCPGRVEYYSAITDGRAIGMTKTRTVEREKAELPLFPD